HGPMLTADDREHRLVLERLACDVGVGERVTFGEAVPHGGIAPLLADADALVNATAGHAADKVVYEAAASCLPVFAASPVFDGLLPDGLRFDGDEPGSLAARIRGYAGHDTAALRERVAGEHSVDGWADRVLAVLAR
ncbi:MAG TPA: hypothetical protein VE261_04375, partial [Gaiellaceae bacterium]|nr:hypothetical protein [Gaiellaceae bacterium]